MRYAQIASGLKMHIVAEPGEEAPGGSIVRAGCLSKPFCGRSAENYRMSCNVPLGHSCKNCLRVVAAFRATFPNMTDCEPA